MDRLGAMQMLVRIIETGSFSAASRQLKIGQPSVSKAIAQLEKHLGVRLLLRTTQGLTPTEAGQAFYQRAKRAIAEVEEAEAAARGASAGLVGKLRVSMTITFARLHVIPRLSSFLEHKPGIEIDLVMADDNIALVEEGVDLAIRMGTLVSSTFTGRRIGQSRRLVMATPDYVSRHGSPEKPSDLAHHQVYVIDNGSEPATSRFKRAGEEMAVSVGARVRLNTGEGVRSAVLAGLGVGIGSEWLFLPEMRSEQLVQLVGDWSLAPMDIWAVFANGRSANAKARAFADFIEEILKEI